MAKKTTSSLDDLMGKYLKIQQEQSQTSQPQQQSSRLDDLMGKYLKIQQEQSQTANKPASALPAQSGSGNNDLLSLAQQMAAGQQQQNPVTTPAETNAAQEPSRYLQNIFDKADARESTLYSGAYADILNREDYAELSQAAGSKLSWMPWKNDILYDYINNINGQREQQDLLDAAHEGGEGYGKYAFMNADEIGVYNYIYATEGKRAANKFLKELEPELERQFYSGFSADLQERALEHPILYSGMTIAAQPARMATSGLALAQDAYRTFTDEEIDPDSKLRRLSRETSNIRNAIATEAERNPDRWLWSSLLSQMGEDTTRMLASDEAARWAMQNQGEDQALNPFADQGEIDMAAKGQIASFVYQTTMSAADSSVNMAVASGLADAYAGLRGLDLTTEAGINAVQKATNVIGSLIMSSEVASLGVAEAKEKGYKDQGALAVGLVRGAVEYASEAIGGDWVISNIRRNPLNFLKTMVLNMIPEGVEEVMSDAMNGVVNLIIDALWDTNESGIPALRQEFRQAGWQQNHPKIAALMDFFGLDNPDAAVVLSLLGDEALSFLGGAFATVGTSAVQTRNVQRGITAVSQQLNTTPEAVVQLMEDYKTDNPGAIYDIAQLTGVSSEEQFRQTSGEGKTAVKILEELRKSGAGTAQAAQTQGQTAQQQTDDTGARYLRQVIEDMDVPEAAQKILVDGLDTGTADAQTYAHAIQEAFKLGQMGLTYEQAKENAKLNSTVNETKFRHAWEIGAQKAGQSTETKASTVRAASVPEYESIEDFSREFSSPEKVMEIFDQAADTDVNEFAAGFRAAYDMGQSGVSANYLTQQNVPTLTEAQRTAAYQLGRADSSSKAQERAGRVAEKQKTGELSRVKGTVKGEGVTIADLKKTFNDSQNRAYRLLTRYAETTGVNIVLYNSQADSDTGDYPAAQGRFQWKDDTIYVDINSGLNNVRDVNDLGRYTMLRTFAHEFTHFLEKWNAAQYNEFREFVFRTLEEKGENVHDLIEEKQALDQSGSMTYEQASREVVADAMMDILPDSTLVQQLAAEHRTVFNKLLQKLRDFNARLKQAYREMTGKAPREAQALKENGAYMDGIVDMWDKIARGAVANYQGANGEAVTQAEQQKKKTRSTSQNTKTAKNETKEKAPVSNTSEAVLSQEAQPAENETAPDTPQEAVQEPAAQTEPDTPAAPETSAPEATASNESPEAAKLRSRLSAENVVDLNGFEFNILGMRSTTVNIAEGGVSNGMEYYASIRQVADAAGVPVSNARELYRDTFPTREAAVDALVSVAENNNLLKEAQTDERTEKAPSEAPAVGAAPDADRNGDGAVRVSSEQPEGPVQGNAEGREPAAVSPERGGETGRDGDRADAERNGRSRRKRSGKSRVQSGRGTDVTIDTSATAEEAAAPMTEEEQAISEDEDEGNTEYSLRVKQEFSSAATSLNQVAALFKSKVFDPGDVNIDIGGGAYNATTEYLAERYGTTNMVYDPYNRGSEENLAVVEWLRAGNRADTATCANVLNVIREQESRRNVILEVAKSIKDDGTAYFSVYEKDKSGQGRQTGKDQWQNSRATADYVHEIEEFFDNVERRGAVIVATDPKEDLPSAYWRITENEEIEYASRRDNGLSNRELLSMAADELDTSKLSEAELGALRIFQKRLDMLEDLQTQRAEMGREYKDKQFTKGGSRAEAERILSAMKILDSKIKSLENSIISLENKDVLKSVLEKARTVAEQQERKRGDETLKRYRQRRNESANIRKYRQRVRSEVENLRKWLMAPSNKDVKKHVPAEIQKTVVDFLDSINLMSKKALNSGGLETTKADEKYLKNMRKLRDAIKSNVDGNELYRYAFFTDDFMRTFDALVQKAEEHMSANSGEYVVNRMSAAELRELSHTLKTLRKIITTMNQFHDNATYQHAYEAGEETIDYLSGFDKSKKSGFLHKFFSFDYMRPSYAFERMGKGGQSIEHEFREGQAVQARLANAIIDFAKKTYTAKEVKEWSEQTKTFDLADGESVTLPITHIMSLYCLNKRAQALTHIYGDGIRVANYKNGRQVQLDEGHTVTIDDVKRMTDSLTERQKAVADALQKYMSTESAAWGNYVSMARFDVEQFTEQNYFPINSDGRYLAATADETPDNAGLYALLNSSFTKELKENASNRIILYNIFDVFANHTASMTQYRAFALPVLDALKWFNYKNDDTSVRTKLSSAFGAPVDERAGSGSKGYAEQFVINLLRAYNGTAAQGDPYDSFGLRALHRFNRAQIAFNFRVVVQQPMAITRAAMMLSPAKLLKGLSMSAANMKKLAAEMEEHSGIAAWKALGFYDTNISRGLTELIKQNPSFGDRVTEFGTKYAETADRFTWAAMWYAAKSSVNRSSYTTEEAYYKAVTELFEDVIYKTQVVDSVLTKSEFLRSKGFFPRAMGAFMSEPMTTTSMLTDAYYKYSDDMQRGMSRSEAWKKNGGNIAKTAAVYTIGQIMLAAAQGVMDAWRDDDEYDAENWLDNFFQKYLNAFKNNVIEELLPFGKIPVLSELYEGLMGLLDYAGVFDKLGLDLYGNDISNGWAQYAKYLKKGAEITIDLIQGNKTNYTPYGAIYNFIRGAAGATGFPIATAWREFQDIWNNTVGYFAPRYKLDTYQRAIDRAYIEQIRPTGLSMKDFETILEEADERGDGNGSLKQDELGAELMIALGRGDITEEQAAAVWSSRGWKKTFDEWRGVESKPETTTPAPAPAAPSATAAPSQNQSRGLFDFQMEAPAATAAPRATAAPEQQKPAGITTFQQFQSEAPIYGADKRQAAYDVWQNDLRRSGMTLDRYTEILSSADTDGNGSLKQNELGYALYDALDNREMTWDQAAAVWAAQGWKHSFDTWAAKHP